MLMIIQIVHAAFQIYTLMLFIRILSSWLPQLHEYRFMQFICALTDPYLNLFRKIIPPLGMIDISPIVAFFCLSFIQNIIISIIAGFAR